MKWWSFFLGEVQGALNSFNSDWKSTSVYWTETPGVITKPMYHPQCIHPKADNHNYMKYLRGGLDHTGSLLLLGKMITFFHLCLHMILNTVHTYAKKWLHSQLHCFQLGLKTPLRHLPHLCIEYFASVFFGGWDFSESVLKLDEDWRTPLMVHSDSFKFQVHLGY